VPFLILLVCFESAIIVMHHFLKLLLSLSDPLPIIAVHDKDQALGVLEVMTPKWPDFVLAADVPHSEADVLVFHCLDIEPNSGNSGDNLAKLELVQDRGLTGSIESDHQDPHLLLPEELPKTLERVSPS